MLGEIERAAAALFGLKRLGGVSALALDSLVKILRGFAGQFLGEMGLIEKTARSATAISLSDDTELQVIDEENFAQWFAENPEEMRYLLQQMSLRLRRTSRDYADVCRTVNDVVEAEKAGTQKDPSLQNRIMKTLAGFEAFRLEGSREGEEA